MAERVDRALMYARELFQGLRRTSKIERAQEHAEYVATAIEVALEGVCFECEMMRGGGEIAQRQRTIRAARAARRRAERSKLQKHAKARIARARRRLQASAERARRIRAQGKSHSQR
jgi:hypothetical protein